MSLLKFLQTAKVEEVNISSKASSLRKQYNPNPALVAIRVFADGSVYPSTAAVEKFDLEYKDAVISVETLPLKDGETVPKTKNAYTYPNGQGNGIDLLDSRVWGQVKMDGAMLFIAVTPKSEPKIDMFGFANYDEVTGKAKVSVMSQGALTFGQKVLVPAIEQVYGITFGVPERVKEGIVLQPAIEGVEYVDMVIFEELDGFNITEQFSKPILLAPKRVIRGVDQGKPDYVRREGVKVYGFSPLSLVNPTEATNGFVAGEHVNSPIQEVDRLPIVNEEAKAEKAKAKVKA